MSHDQILRIVLTAVLVLVLPIGIYHRVKSEATREKLDRRQEGVFILATLRPAGAAFWLATIGWMIDPRWMAWSSVPLPVWARWMGVGLAAVAGVLLVWTFRSLGTNLTDTVVTRRTHTLVLHGPYRWIRHPFYDSAALLMMAISLITANWFLVLTGVATFGLLVLRTRIEEENLLTRFGDSYRQYMAQTGRFFPRVLLIVLVAVSLPATPQSRPAPATLWNRVEASQLLHGVLTTPVLAATYAGRHGSSDPDDAWSRTSFSLPFLRGLRQWPDVAEHRTDPSASHRAR